MLPNPYLVGTTMLFLIPVVIAASLGAVPYALTFLLLTVASISYHSTKNTALFWVDQGACGAAALALCAAGFTGLWPATVSALTISGISILYYYGWAQQRLVWSTDFWTATSSHMLMHLIAVIGATTTLWLAYKDNSNIRHADQHGDTTKDNMSQHDCQE